MKKHLPLLLLAIGLLAADDAPAQQRPAKPNFLLILADDLGWQDVKVYDLMETDVVGGFGGTNVFETPYMDQLASEGTLFTQAYSAAPVCAPSRVAIMSGKHPGRTDVTSVSGGKCPKAGGAAHRTVTPHFRSSLKDEEISLAEALNPLGYFSGVFGKWHMSPDGHHYTFPLPTDQGFDEAYNGRGVQSGMNRLTGFATSDPSDPYQLDANGFAKDPVTQEALGFLADAVSLHPTQPFFCYYSTWLVHGPWQMRTESLLQKYAALMGYDYPLDGTEIFAEGQHNPYYAAMVESLDYYMHQLLTFLEDTDDPRWPGHKLSENTYVVFTSDNGGMEIGDPSGQVTDNYPLDKGKIWIKEGGTRVPFIVRGPGIPSNIVSDVVVNGLDLYPTFLALAGEPVPGGLDGCDLSNLLLNDPQDPALVQHPSGTVRESMFWHFPHSGRVATTLVKNGWKLYKNYDYLWNAAAQQPYSLYELYDSNGDAVDLGEMTDLIDAQPAVASELIAEIEAWIAQVDARPLYFNPKRGTLPGTDQSLTILSSGNDDTVAWVTWNTGRAAVKHLDLLYTKSPTADGNEEWFKIPVPFTHSRGWAEVAIPEGAQSFLFNLIDDNGFFVSSVDLTAHTGYDSALVPLRSWLPQRTATFAYAGATFPSGDVLFGNSINEGAFSAVRDDGANLQLQGQTFTVTEPVRLSALTLQSYLDLTVGTTDASEYYLWIGRYESGAPSEDTPRTRVYEKIDMRGVSLATDQYYKIDFEDTVLAPGTYAFQLRWKEQGSANNSYWARANGNGAYAGGDRISIFTTAGSSVDFPYSQVAGTGTDLVFALHGTTDFFGGWAAENALDRIPEDPRPNGVGGSVVKNNVFYNKSASSAWEVSNGVLSNASSANNNVGEGAIGICIDVTGLAASDQAQLSLSFDYTTGDAGEKLFVHLWGCNDLNPDYNTYIMNLGAQNGNAWFGAGAWMDVYNLAGVNGVFTSTEGYLGDAAATLTGSTGAQSYSNTFDLAEFTTAPDAVSEYDYIVLGFAREVGGTTTPSVSITNIRLSIAGGATLHEFPPPETFPASHCADPDGDGLDNLTEFALGGDPTLGGDHWILPTWEDNGGTMEFAYYRRVNPASHGLTYTVKTSTDLIVWGTGGYGSPMPEPFDDDFEKVPINVSTTGTARRFVRLEIESD